MMIYMVYQGRKTVDGIGSNYYLVKYVEDGVRKEVAITSNMDELLGWLIDFKLINSKGKVHFAKRSKAPDPIELESIIETFEKIDWSNPGNIPYKVEIRTS